MNTRIMVYEDKVLVNKKEVKTLEKDIKRGEVIFLDEKILVKRIKIINRKEVEKFIKEKVLNDFDIENTLIHYEIDKKNRETIVYIMKNSYKILSLMAKIKNPKIEPVGFSILKKAKKKFKYKNFYGILKRNYVSNFIEVENGIIKKYDFIKEDDNIDDYIVNKEYPLIKGRLIEGKQKIDIVLSKNTEEF